MGASSDDRTDTLVLYLYYNPSTIDTYIFVRAPFEHICKRFVPTKEIHILYIMHFFIEVCHDAISNSLRSEAGPP